MDMDSHLFLSRRFMLNNAWQKREILINVKQQRGNSGSSHKKKEFGQIFEHETESETETGRWEEGDIIF